MATALGSCATFSASARSWGSATPSWFAPDEPSALHSNAGRLRCRPLGETSMPIEKWSERVSVVHLADDPQFTDDFVALDGDSTAAARDVVLDFAAVHFINSSNIARLLKMRQTMKSRERK